MPKANLTIRTLDAVEASDRDVFVWDDGRNAIAGLGVKVTPKGKKVFVFQYRMRGENSDRRYTIGRYGEWTPEQARERAKDLRRLVDKGIHPLDHDRNEVKVRERQRVANLERQFEKVAEQWLESYKRGHRLSSNRLAEHTVTHLKTAFRGRNIDEITRGEIVRWIDGFPADQIASRRNHFAYARAFWNWAKRCELVEANPFVSVKAPDKPDSRDRALSDDELSLLWRSTHKLGYPFGTIVRLLALTGQRRQEVTGMSWSELDRANATWTIPKERTKGKRTHIVPLSPMVMAELNAVVPTKDDKPADKWPSKGLIFSTTGKTPVSGHSKAKVRLDDHAATLATKEQKSQVDAWRFHDLRRTMVTGFQRLGIAENVAKAVINHALPKSDALSAYAKHEYADEKRDALNRWAAHIAEVLKPKAISGDHVANGGSPP